MSLNFRHIALAIILACVTPRTIAHATVTVTPIDDNPPPSAPATSQPSSTPPDSSNLSASASADDVKALLDAKKYQEAERLVVRLLDLRGAAAPPDRAQLFILRAECQFQLHQNPSALASLEQAAKEASLASNPDDAGQAAAFTYLIQKSPRDLYTPITGTSKKPIDILDRTTRKTAYQALFADALAILQQKLKTANTDGTLPPILEIAKDVPGLRGAELMSTNATKESDRFASDAARTASKIISTTLSDYETTLSQITMAADQMVPNNTGTMNQYQRVGLTGDQSQTLQNIENTCRRIPAAVVELTKAFNNPDPFMHLATRAEGIADRARAARTKDYSRY